MRSPAGRSPAQLSLFDDEPPALVGAATGWVPAPPAEPAVPAAAEPATLPLPEALPEPAAASPSPPAWPRPPRARHEVVLGPHRLAYELRRARRRSIGFTVGPEGLAVSAPRWVGLAEIESALRSKEGWILRKLQEQQERQRRQLAARVDWRDGATVPFLGETVILLLDPRATGAVLHSADDTLPGVPRLTLHLGLPVEARPEQVRDAVQSWLQRQARRVFEERCAIYAQRLGVQLRRLSISSAATRWGSASADGSIRLNWRLVHFGLPVIDYVVAHELAHLREMNHSPAFWGVVRSVLPGYEQARALLRDQVLPELD
jgi:predicted metal-dependent hydrolase